MRRVFVVLLLILILIIGGGCASQEDGVSEVQEKSLSEREGPIRGPGFGTESTAVADAYPKVAVRLNPSNPSVGEIIIVTVTVDDDKGVESISWESASDFSNQGRTGSFRCDLQKVCTTTWEFTITKDGEHELLIFAADSVGQKGRTPLKINVQPMRQITTTTSANTTVANSTKVNETIPDSSCSSHSDCGYKERCIGSVCQSVACTSDSHCSGCRRCSSNNCVSCGSGPYGCYC